MGKEGICIVFLTPSLSTNTIIIFLKILIHALNIPGSCWSDFITYMSFLFQKHAFKKHKAQNAKKLRNMQETQPG